MKPTTELLHQLKSSAQEEIMCREASDTSDAWQDLASPENILALIEIALPVLEQGGWISCSERMPPGKTGVLVGCWYGREWATKWATLIHGHPDASNEGWIIPGASWVPTHWHELPPQPQTSTPQIDNDGREG